MELLNGTPCSCLIISSLPGSSLRMHVEMLDKLLKVNKRSERERAGCFAFLSSWCLVIAVCLFLMMPRVCLQFVIVVFPDHTHLLFLISKGTHLAFFIYALDTYIRTQTNKVT